MICPLLTIVTIALCFSVSYQDSFDIEIENKRNDGSLSLKLNFGENKVDLRLKPNDLMSSRTPILIGNITGHQYNISYWLGTVSKEFQGFYDPSSGASFIILPDMTIQGIFRHHAEEYYVARPEGGISGRRKRSLNLYTAVKINKDTLAKPPDGIPKKDIAFSEEMKSFLLQDSATRWNYVVEIIIMVDYSIFKSWYILTDPELDASKRHEMTIEKMRYYYACIANAMDTRYSTIKENDFSIRIKVNAVYIATAEAASPWTNNYLINVGGEQVLDVYKAIDKIPEWLRQNSKLFPQFDSILIFTHSPMFAGYYQANIPRFISCLANIKAICSEEAVSFSRDRGEFGTAGTASHELAHNLGSLHDNYLDNSCNPNEQYLMSPSPGELNNSTFLHAFQFSPCSIDYFRRYLGALTFQGKNCLLQTKADIDQNVPANVQLGQFIKVDTQCQLVYGRESFYCGGHDNDKIICEKLTCYSPIEMRCVTRVDQRAATGTTCGNKKWCDQGLCTKNQAAPVASDFCLYGDYKGPDVNCPALIFEDRSRCYQTFYFERCCTLCEYVKSSNLGCQYGDQTPSYCLQMSAWHCYDENVRALCCQTCKSFQRTIIKGCEFGNKASWCASITPSSCYVDNFTCCETCAANFHSTPGCEYGDKVIGCNKSYPGHCSINKERCCFTCNSPIGSPLVTNDPSVYLITRASDSVGFTTQYHPKDLKWCSIIPPLFCYSDKGMSHCSQTCLNLQREVKGCEFGDKHLWCGNLTRSECGDLGNPADCCSFCSGSRSRHSGVKILSMVAVIHAVLFTIYNKIF